MASELKTNLQSTPRLARLQTIFDQKFKLSGALIGQAMSKFGPRWAEEFEAVIVSLFADDEALEAALKGYSLFALDSMRRQKVFEQTREYPNKSYAQAADEVYFDEAYMMREYLPGLLLSHFLWPHHYRQLQFFDTAFIKPMSLGHNARFIEVGVGTGVYSRRILSQIEGAVGTGYDVSPSSCQFAMLHMVGAKVQHRFTMHKQDIIAKKIIPEPWLVCVEVLEHLERPVEFLEALRRGLALGGRAFITAALNAAHADHIYLYRNAEEVWSHLEEAGFRVEQSFVAAAYAPPGPDIPVPLTAAFVVY